MKSFYTAIFLFIVFQSNAQKYSRASVHLYTDSVTNDLIINDMAFDADGNSYSCGYEIDTALTSYEGHRFNQRHLVVIKLNAAGKLKWKRYFNDVKDSADEALAVKLDTEGFVYVTGIRYDRDPDYCGCTSALKDLITIKYNSAGDRVWLNRFHSGDSIFATPSAISLSSNGAVLITANELDYRADLRTYLSKLLVQSINHNGKTSLIIRRTNISGYSGCFDKNNNIIVAGSYDYTRVRDEEKAAILVKFNSEGDSVWSDIFQEPNSIATFRYVYSNNDNTIYTCGDVDSFASQVKANIIIEKYTESGKRLWFQKDNKGSSLNNFKIDQKGNSYATGQAQKGGWITIKYNTNGVKEWSRTATDTTDFHIDIPYAIAVDTSTGNVFVAGYFRNSEFSYSATTIGYDINGNTLFSDTYFKHREESFSIGIGIDKNGNVYSGVRPFKGRTYVDNSIGILKYSKTLPPFANAQKSGTETSLNLYPNPVTNNFTADFTTPSPSKNYKLIVSDVSGNIVLTKQLSYSEKIMHINVDVRSLKTGVYTVNITDGFNNVSKTFLKQ